MTSDDLIRPLIAPLDVLQLYAPHDYTLWGVMQSRMQRDPARPCLIYDGKTLSWREFSEQALQLARAFAGIGIASGDRVALMAGNSDAHLMMLFALARLGAIIVTINPGFGVEEARYVLEHAEVSGVVTVSGLMPTVTDAMKNMQRRPWIALLDQALPGAAHLRELAAQAPTSELPALPSADTTCLMIYTSGTTGFPKGVMHSQRNFVLSGEASVQRVSIQADDRVMIVLPLFHVNALMYSAAGAIAAGAAIIVVPKFSASGFWNIAADGGATIVNVIEAIGLILKNRPRSEFRPDHKLRVVYGVRPNVLETFRDEFHVPSLYGGYGMTEVPGVTCMHFTSMDKAGMGQVGRHPDPNRKWAVCRVVDDEGVDVAPGAEGELWVQTPVLMQGYFRDPEQTAASFRDGWFMTGDLVKRDSEGYLYFVSRKKDIIRRRGENIAGAEIDRVIAGHPAVYEVAALAVPSELGEDDILAAIVTKPGHTVSAQDIAQWCRDHLAPMKVPRYVLFVDELPHTPTHKIAKAALRQDASLKQRATEIV